MKATDSISHETLTVAEASPFPASPRQPSFDGTDWERGVLLSRLDELEQENRELRRANEILRRAAVYFNRPHNQLEG